MQEKEDVMVFLKYLLEKERREYDLPEDIKERLLKEILSAIKYDNSSI